MFKRGLSSVITTVLLILLALAAAVILGAFLNLTISSIKGTDLKSTTAEIKLNPNSVSSSNGNVSFIVTSGEQSGVSDIYAVLKDSSGNTKSFTVSGISSGSFQTTSVSLGLSNSGLSNVTEVCVYPIIIQNDKQKISEISNCYPVIISSDSSENSQDSISQDESHLLLNLNITLLKNSQGNPSFIVMDGNTILRAMSSGESFYFGGGSGLVVNYEIEKKNGGVDVIYHISNPSSSTQNLPSFRIQGINQKSDENFRLLWKKDYGNIMPVFDSSGNMIIYEYRLTENPIMTGTLLEFSNLNNYPTVYSPVSVTLDSNYAVGSSFQYPYLKYKHSIYPVLKQDTLNKNLWTHEYSSPKEESDSKKPAFLSPGETRDYVISLRFSSPEHWITTLYPYKLYFQSLYESSASRQPLDRRPILYSSLTTPNAVNLTSNPPNPRGFNSFRVDLYGWKNHTDDILNRAKKYGFKRFELWTSSGRFDVAGFDMPSQFMDWTPKQIETQSEFDKFTQNGIEYGFWWGQSSEFPVYADYNQLSSWGPSSQQALNYSNSSHKAFFDNQLNKAVQRGATFIGLDEFFSIPFSKKYYFVDTIKQMAPGVLFTHEGSGPDFMHSKIGNYYWPEFNVPGRWIYGQDMLTCYLNPNSDIQVMMRSTLNKKNMYLTQNLANARLPNSTDMQNLVNWGFSPIVGVGDVNVTKTQYPSLVCPPV